MNTHTSHLHGLAMDIDDTLSDTARTCVERMAQEFPVGETFDTDRWVEKYGQPGSVPEWHTDSAQARISQLLNDDDFLLGIPPIKEAQEKLPAIASLTPISLYITSRTHDRRTVTEQWLKLHGFPAVPIITRDPLVTAPDWKVRFLAQKFPHLVGLVDNEIRVSPDSDIPAFKGHLIQLNPYLPASLNRSIKYFTGWAQLQEFLEKK